MIVLAARHQACKELFTDKGRAIDNLPPVMNYYIVGARRDAGGDASVSRQCFSAQHFATVVDFAPRTTELNCQYNKIIIHFKNIMHIMIKPLILFYLLQNCISINHEDPSTPHVKHIK